MHGHGRVGMVLLQGFGDEEATPRQYLENSELLMVLQRGMDELLKTCTADGENGGPSTFTEDPINFLATWLKRNNPAHNADMRLAIETMRLAIPLPEGHVETKQDRPLMLARLFATVDADADGTITLKEYCAMFDTADTDKDGRVDAEIESQFAALDVDGDGEISKREFITAKLEEFKLDDDYLFDSCMGGDRISMVQYNKAKASEEEES